MVIFLVIRLPDIHLGFLAAFRRRFRGNLLRPTKLFSDRIHACNLNYENFPRKIIIAHTTWGGSQDLDGMFRRNLIGHRIPRKSFVVFDPFRQKVIIPTQIPRFPGETP